MTTKRISKKQLAENVRNYVYEVLEEELDKRLKQKRRINEARQNRIVTKRANQALRERLRRVR